VAAELRVTGARVEAVAADMGSANQVVALAEQHREHHAHLNLLVLCAGMGAAGDLATFPCDASTGW
jgi:short-subunit dehydrogenase